MRNGPLEDIRSRPAALTWLAPALLVACAGTPSEPPRSATAGSPESVPAAADEDHWLVASLRAGAIGPHWAEHGEHRLAAWAVPGGDAAGWFTLALPRDRSPGAPLRIGDVPAGLEIVRLLPDGASGFVLLTTRRLDAAYLVEARHLGPEGVLRSGPHVLGESPARIVWVDAVPTTRGALVVWAERAGDRADLYAVPAGPLGPERRGRRLARRALSWQLAPFGRAAALASIEESEGRSEVAVRFIADDANEATPEVRLEATRPGPELDLAVTPRRAVVAWTEEQNVGRRVMLAELGAEGALRGEPWPATAPRGDQSLVELVGDGDHVYLAWDEQAQRPLVGSNVLLASVGEPGATLEGPRVALDVSGYDGTLPTFVGRAEGLLAVTRASSCAGAPGGGEDAADVITLVDFDRELDVRGAGEVRVGSGTPTPAELLWDVRCREDCWALAARTQSFLTQVYLERLATRAAAPTPVTRVDGVFPRVASQVRVGQVMDLAALDGWVGAPGPTLSWLSYFDPTTPWEVPARPAPDGRRAPVRAVLRTQVVGPGETTGGPTVGAEETISWRAHSPGGLTWAAAPSGDEKLLVWSALDDQEPQVFATIVDPLGKRLRQRMVTRAAGAVHDVAAVAVDGGWLLSWIDGRGESLEPYAVRLDEKLQSVSPERPLDVGARSPAGLELLRRGELVFAAWSDVRGTSAEAQGDVYLAVLSALDGSVIAPGRRVAATPHHSHSPKLEPFGDGAVLAWIDADAELEWDHPGAFVALQLDASGRSLGAAEATRVDGRPTSFGLRCDAECRVVVTVDAGPRSELWGGSWRPGPGEGGRALKETELRLLSALRGRHADAAAPLLLGDDVYYVDGEDRTPPSLHRLGVRWR